MGGTPWIPTDRCMRRGVESCAQGIASVRRSGGRLCPARRRACASLAAMVWRPDGGALLWIAAGGMPVGVRHAARLLSDPRTEIEEWRI